MAFRTTTMSNEQEIRFLGELKRIGVESIEKITDRRELFEPRTYYSASLSGRKIFIKLIKPVLLKRMFKGMFGINQFDCETEFTLGNRLHRINPNNFPEALFFLKDKTYSCIAHEFLEGKSFRAIKLDDLPLSQKENLIVQLTKIAESLWETGIVHRDIYSWNFILLNDGTLKLIDFGCSYDYEDPPWMKRHSILRKCPPLFHMLVRQKYNDSKRFDDYHSMLKFLQRIGFHESYRTVYRELESFLKQRIGKRLYVESPYRALIFAKKVIDWLNESFQARHPFCPSTAPNDCTRDVCNKCVWSDQHRPEINNRPIPTSACHLDESTPGPSNEYNTTQ